MTVCLNWNYGVKFKWESSRKNWMVDFIISAFPGCPSFPGWTIETTLSILLANNGIDNGMDGCLVGFSIGSFKATSVGRTAGHSVG